jgi:hypothetical protein
MFASLFGPFMKWCLPSMLFATALFVLALVYDERYGKRRSAYRFGGTEPFSFGEKRAWMKYLMYAFVWEIVKSFFTVDTARELGATLFQAPLLTVAWFICDRLHMAYEYKPYVPELPQRVSHHATESLPNDGSDEGADADLARFSVEPEVDNDNAEEASPETVDERPVAFLRRTIITLLGGDVGDSVSEETKRLAREHRGRH